MTTARCERRGQAEIGVVEHEGREYAALGATVDGRHLAVVQIRPVAHTPQRAGTAVSSNVKTTVRVSARGRSRCSDWGLTGQGDRVWMGRLLGLDWWF